MKITMTMLSMLTCIGTTINILNVDILSKEEMMQRFKSEDDTVEHPHYKQTLDLVA